MTKQIKISEFVFKELWKEKKHCELKLHRNLSYSEIIGLLLGYELSEIKRKYKKNRYGRFRRMHGARVS